MSPAHRQPPGILRRWFVVIILALQCLLLFSNLGMLPIWTDELFTFHTVRQETISEILLTTQSDIHPPLYYLLLHSWPWHTLEGMRAFSAVWALAATLLLDLLWTSRWRFPRRVCALLLFALSPCLLLYGRMARSYSMQMVLAMVSVYFLWSWYTKRSGAWKAYAACLVLLYTHYIPGIAVLAAFCLIAWSALGILRIMLFGALLCIGYFPWLQTLAFALRRWGAASGFSSQYLLSGSPTFEHVLKTGYGAVSFTIGESFYSASLLLVPMVLWLIWRGTRQAVRRRGVFVMFLCTAGLLGYLGVSHWVSFPFIPARLLWLLPFVTLAMAIGIRQRVWILALLLVSSAGSIFSYFSQVNYLNKGYAAPTREIAQVLNRRASPSDLVLLDAYNTDGGSLRYYLSKEIRPVNIDPEKESAIVRDAAASRTVWVVRNQRDISPGHLTTQTTEATCSGRHKQETLFVPYSWWERKALPALAAESPTHFYGLVSCSPIAPQ